MPSTHLSLHIHVVFGTKERRALIDEPWRPRLHAYLGGTIHAAGGLPEAVGGTGDHVHLLLQMRATHRLADLVRDIKTASSEWVHREIRQWRFQWQEGYGAFTVSSSLMGVVKRYIENQAEHHRRKDFQEEYRDMLRKCGVAFDERYLW